MSEKKKMSGAKIAGLTVSIALHAALAFYLGRMALDYALPKGEVTSYEMDFSQGDQAATTPVDVVETTPPTKVETPLPPKPAPPKPIAKTPEPPKALPAKEVKETPVEDKQGEMPVATEIPEDTHKEMMEEEKPAVPQEEPKEVAQDAPPEIIPAPPAQPEAVPAPVAQEGSASSGTPDGVQSDTVLVPYGSNKGITYPFVARMRKLEGVTLIHYTVSGEGQVTDVKIVESSGHASLDNQAVDTIKNWKFKPTGKEGVYERPVRFQLTGEAKAAPSQLRRLDK